jgi:hypothetical protein
MNLYDFNTKADLDQWAIDCLVVRTGISVSPTTGYNRAVALIQFNAMFNLKQIHLNVGVFELDPQGNPIRSKSLIPYEELIIADNSQQVDIETMVITPIEDQDPNKTYMGEYDAYVYITKNNPVQIWNLFEASIQNSSKFK